MKWIIAGVSGCGKSTVGRHLAAQRKAAFLDADDFHPEANREKMRLGQPLADEDREGWLAALGGAIASEESPLVVACSALKRSYRDRLRAAEPTLRFVLLEVGETELRERLDARAGFHFFAPSLLRSQLDTLERGDDFDAVVENRGPVDAVAERILRAMEE